MDITDDINILRKVVNKVYTKVMKDGDVRDIKNEYNLVEAIYNVCLQNANDHKTLMAKVTKALKIQNVQESFSDL